MFLVLVRFRNAVVGPEQGQDGSSRFRILAHGGHSNFFKQKSHAEFTTRTFTNQDFNGVNLALFHRELLAGCHTAHSVVPVPGRTVFVERNGGDIDAHFPEFLFQVVIAGFAFHGIKPFGIVCRHFSQRSGFPAVVEDILFIEPYY